MLRRHNTALEPSCAGPWAEALVITHKFRADLRRIPKGFHNIAQGWRAAPTLGNEIERFSTPRGLRPRATVGPQPRWGWDHWIGPQTQGRRSAPTLGWRSESLRDSRTS